MKQFTHLILKQMNKNNFYPKDEILFIYGMNIFGRYVLFIFFIIVFSMFSGNFLYVIYYDILLILFRFHTGGYHSQNIFNCFLLSLSILVFIPTIVIRYSSYIYSNFFLTTFCYFFIYYITPISNPKKHLNKYFISKINIRKKIVVSFFYFVYLFQLHQRIAISNMTMLAYLCNTISIFIELINKRRRNYVFIARKNC